MAGADKQDDNLEKLPKNVTIIDHYTRAHNLIEIIPKVIDKIPSEALAVEVSASVAIASALLSIADAIYAVNSFESPQTRDAIATELNKVRQKHKPTE